MLKRDAYAVRAAERRAQWLADQRRMEISKAMTPRARAGGPDGRDPRFAELDALIADEARYGPQARVERYDDESEGGE